MENLIDGRRIAAEIHAETQQRVQRLREKGIQPGLVFIRVGEDPASRVYVGMKEEKRARNWGLPHPRWCWTNRPLKPIY